MSIRVTCPDCEASFSVADNMRGKKILCRECKKSIVVKGKADDADDDDDKVMDRKGKPVPAKSAVRHRDDDDDDDDDEDDEDEDEAPRAKKKKKAGTSPMVFIAGGGGLALIAGVVLFLVMGGSDSPAPPPVAQNNPPPVAPAAPTDTPPTVPNREAAPDVKPAPEKKTETPPPDPETMPVSVTSFAGEQVYDRLLKSTVWIVAKQKKALTIKIPAELLAGGNNPGQDTNKLVNSVWAGTETLQGYGKLEFHFKTNTTVEMHDKDGKLDGTYVQRNNKVTLGFGGSVLYMGTVNGDTMTGSARNGSNTWTFSVNRQAGAPQAFLDSHPRLGEDAFQLTQFPRPRPQVPRPPQMMQPRPPQMRPPMMRPPKMPNLKPPKMFGPGPSTPLPKDVLISIQPTFTGTGSLVDVKHRLVMTNVHVVGDPESLVLYFPTPDSKGELLVTRDEYKAQPGIKGKVVMREDRADLALVQLESLPTGVAPIALAKKSARPAQQVHSMGNPGASGALWAYSPGKVRGAPFKDKWDIPDDLEGVVKKYDARILETDSAINSGDSGGPLVNDRAVVVGVAHATMSKAQNMSIFIDVSECRLLMDKYYKSIGETWVPIPEPKAQDDIAKLPDLLKKLENKDFAVRLQAIQALGNLGADASVAFKDIFNALKDDKDAVRLAAIDAIEKIPPHKSNVGLLCETLQSSDEPMEVRLLAVRSLARLGNDGKPALPTLIKQMKDAGDQDLRRQALVSLVAIGPESKDVPVLAESLKNTDVDTRRLVVEALVKLGPDAQSVVPILLTTMKTADKKLRVGILQALEAIGDKKTIPAILDLAKEGSDPTVTVHASLALIKLGDSKAAVPYLLESVKSTAGQLRKKAIRGLSGLGADAKPALKELIVALDDDDIRPDAQAALIGIGKAGADTIADRMVKEVRNAKARMACIEVVGEIGYASPKVLNNLRSLILNDPVQANKDAAQRVWKKLTGQG